MFDPEIELIFKNKKERIRVEWLNYRDFEM